MSTIFSTAFLMRDESALQSLKRLQYPRGDIKSGWIIQRLENSFTRNFVFFFFFHEDQSFEKIFLISIFRTVSRWRRGFLTYPRELNFSLWGWIKSTINSKEFKVHPFEVYFEIERIRSVSFRTEEIIILISISIAH